MFYIPYQALVPSFMRLFLVFSYKTSGRFSLPLVLHFSLPRVVVPHLTFRPWGFSSWLQQFPQELCSSVQRFFGREKQSIKSARNHVRNHPLTLEILSTTSRSCIDVFSYRGRGLLLLHHSFLKLLFIMQLLSVEEIGGA